MSTRQSAAATARRVDHAGPAWPEPMPIRTWMQPAPTVIRADADVGAAAALMRTRKIRHLLVIDAEERLVGIVTDRDLRQVILDPDIQAQLGAAPRAPNVLTVGEVMTWGAITVRPDSVLREAARVMHAHKVGALPVVEHSRWVGILAETDLVKAFIDALGQGVLSKLQRWGLEQ